MDNCFNSSNSSNNSSRNRFAAARRKLGAVAQVLSILPLCCAASARLCASPPTERPYHVNHYDVAVQPDLTRRIIFGAVTISLTALSERLPSVELDAAEITVLGCSVGKTHLRYVLAGDVLRVDLPRPLRKGQHMDLRIAYRATPTRGVAFFSDQAYTAFATSHWLPCNDRPNDRASFRLVVVAPDRFQVVASGAAVREVAQAGQRTSEWREDRPIPTFVFGFALGRFRFESRQAGKVQLRLAIPAPAEKKDAAGQASSPPASDSAQSPAPAPPAEPAPAQAHPDAAAAASLHAASLVLDETSAALAFFEKISGVPYSAGAYTTVFAHDNVMQEARRFTLLPEAYLLTLENHPDDLWLLAHELAHQWWGIGMTGRDWSDFWLNEGVATFVADAFLEKRFGHQRYAAELARSRKIFEDAVAAARARPLHFTQWTRPAEAGGPIPYHKGALFLDLLRSRLGEQTFWGAFQDFSKHFMGQSVTSRQFQASLERSCHCDLSDVFQEWVYL